MNDYSFLDHQSNVMTGAALGAPLESVYVEPMQAIIDWSLEAPDNTMMACHAALENYTF